MDPAVNVLIFRIISLELSLDKKQTKVFLCIFHIMDLKYNQEVFSITCD